MTRNKGIAGTHSQTRARPDEKMGQQRSKRTPLRKDVKSVPGPTSVQRQVEQRAASKKRRQRDVIVPKSM